MMPIFDELLYAENLLSHGFVKLMSSKDLEILAKFYFFKELNEEQVVKKLHAFCYIYNPEYNEIIFGNTIEKAIKKAKKTPLHIPHNVIITRGEIEKIKQIKNYRLEKILFIFLVCAKFGKQDSDKWWDKKRIPKNTRLYVNHPLSPILSLAKVHANRKEQGEIKNKLNNNGYILSKTKGHSQGSFEVLYADSNSENIDVFAEINSRDDFLDFYPPYLICLGCGKEIDKSSNSKKYCVDCWMHKRKEEFLNHNR